jgi:hypothetical protein
MFLATTTFIAQDELLKLNGSKLERFKFFRATFQRSDDVAE